MKIISIEPTPSPNSMKLNMDESLSAGKSLNYTTENKDGSPAYIRQLFDIPGIKGVFQVADFIAIERSPKVDWKLILSETRKRFDQEESAFLNEVEEEGSFGEIQVYIQFFKGIPMQIKLVSSGEEVRVGLPKPFSKAIMQAQGSVENVVLERKWIEKGVRYGECAEVGEQVAEEIVASYDEDRLSRLVARALSRDSDAREEEFSAALVASRLDHPDWKVRYAALERMKLTEGEIPLLEKALKDPQMSIRRIATAFLGEIGGVSALELLFQAMRDKSAVVRRTAGDVLSDLGDSRAMEMMILALQDPSKLVRWRAARFLYEIGDETAITALREVQDDVEFEVSLQVRIALERIEGGEAAKGTVWQQMTNRDRG